MSNFRELAEANFTRLQNQICAALSEIDRSKPFMDDRWKRDDQTVSGGDGGGGLTRVLRGGEIFESAGVNFSNVQGTLPREMTEKLTGRTNEASFFATGVSIVIHPRSPMIPTTHANFRYLEVDDLQWFGGGTDLTPYYLFEEDAQHYHRVLRDVCQEFSPDYYDRFKKWCDEYFYLPHREEHRGVGGIFFDYLGKEDPAKLGEIFPFVIAAAESISKAYLPIVRRRLEEPWGERERHFQLVRRGRYVEFNLLYDRGTLFGLKTGGRTESILMSLPPEVRWEYNAQFVAGSREGRLLEVVRNPQDWLRE